jgi:Gp157 protein
MAALAVVPVTLETVSGLSRRLAELLEQSESEGVQGQLPDATREQATGLVEALRRRIVRKPDRDHRSLFDLDDRLIELMGLVEEAADAGAEISTELAQEIDTYLEAYRLKVDCIVGYWRWQQSIADISSKEAERLAARKKAAENRVTRLKGFLFAFMMARGIKKLEGEKSDIGIQRNSTASLAIDDPLQIAEHFFERNVRFNKTELQEIVYQLTEGEVRRRLELALRDGWEVNGEAIRAALVNQEAIAGARLVTGSHVRVR